MAKTIPIANPFPGGATYTTVKKALEYVETGRATISNGAVYFLPHAAHQPIHDNPFNPIDAVFWNGSDRRPWAMRKPGEVRS